MSWPTGRALLRILLAILVLAMPLWPNQSGDASTVTVRLSGKEWSVAVNVAGLTVTKNGVQPDGRHYLLAESDEGFAFSLYLEKLQGTAESAGCHDSLARRAEQWAPVAKDIKWSKSDEMETLQFLIPEYHGAKVQQENVFGCLAREDVYLDVHASKTLYTADDEKRLRGLVASVRFVEGGGVAVEGEDLKTASRFYLAGDYARAIPSYEKVLQREKAHRQLNPTLWRVLVDNLGMAYGIKGDLKRAKETFDYGVSQDPTYPMFYYNLACTYAEMGDQKTTTGYLKQAFQYRANVLHGESMPDPCTDSSFDRFMKDKEFKAFLDSLMADSK